MKSLLSCSVHVHWPGKEKNRVFSCSYLNGSVSHFFSFFILALKGSKGKLLNSFRVNKGAERSRDFLIFTNTRNFRFAANGLSNKHRFQTSIKNINTYNPNNLNRLLIKYEYISVHEHHNKNSTSVSREKLPNLATH